MLCPECGLVAGPGPMDVRNAGARNQDRAIETSSARFMRLILSGFRGGSTGRNLPEAGNS